MVIPDDKQRTELEWRHKSLRGTNWRLASDPTMSYNCIAFVLGITSQRWQPEPMQGDYWPTDIPQDDSEDAWIALFRKFGFEPCANSNFEKGFSKIVIYADEEGATHVAKVIENGLGHSKMGHLADIIHPLNALDGYGTPTHFLKRQAGIKKPSRVAQRRSHRRPVPQRSSASRPAS